MADGYQQFRFRIREAGARFDTCSDGRGRWPHGYPIQHSEQVGLHPRTFPPSVALLSAVTVIVLLLVSEHKWAFFQGRSAQVAFSAFLPSL